ncbi:HAD-IIIA family hydrolase [Treponema sp. TIM-1]|uniref:HAD-IIIA family hydrolase n=1 Tax=Treponema sp. TIM-1 TaxID=2898417 RepID=UPI00398165B1
MKTLIMAGGKGTRVSSIASDIPKPMIPICGKPILEYQISCLINNHLKDLVIIIGHLGQHIKDYFGDGSRFGCTISYYTETEPLGTAGALFKLEDITGDFLLINGDLIFDVDLNRLIAFHQEKKALATLVVHPNSHPHDSAIIITDGEGRVIDWLNKEDPRQYYKNLVNSGIHIVSRELLETAHPGKEKVDLDRDILKPLIRSNRIFAYTTPEYIKDMGTVERYTQVSADIKNGMVSRRNLSHPQRAVFIDRDGTVNRLRGFITRPEDFELLEGAAEAVLSINKAGYLAIVITNQPIIARGEATIEELELIHHKMETELGKAGALVNDIFYCPHHPDRGFPGERPEYKIDCDCRKPKPGLILRAAKKYHIDLSQSYMVGDDERDIGAGIAAGCRPVFLTAEYETENRLREKYGPKLLVFKNLKGFTESMIKDNEAAH